MRSIALSGHQYLRNPPDANGLGPFKYTFLAEGDSWMDKSTPFMGSLAEYLAREMDRQGHSVLIINISTAGNALRRVTDVMHGEFAWWLRQRRYDGILFSAGGNDFIDAAKDPRPGEGILFDMKDKPWPNDGYDCANRHAVISLVQSFLNPNFETIYEAVRASNHNAATPFFLNSYDTPVARNAPAFHNVGPWLYAAYQKNNINPILWPELTEGLFKDIKEAIDGWCTGRTQVYAVPTTGLLTPANSTETKSSGDWVNEIHPNGSGWRKQSKIWAKEIISVLSRKS